MDDWATRAFYVIDNERGLSQLLVHAPNEHRRRITALVVGMFLRPPRR